MGKKISGLGDSLVSVATELPTLLGGLMGLVIAPKGGSKGLVGHALDGNWPGALDAVTANYTFYSTTNGQFYLDQGRGIKLLVAGTAISKVIRWIRD